MGLLDLFGKNKTDKPSQDNTVVYKIGLDDSGYINGEVRNYVLRKMYGRDGKLKARTWTEVSADDLKKNPAEFRQLLINDHQMGYLEKCISERKKSRSQSNKTEKKRTFQLISRKDYEILKDLKNGEELHYPENQHRLLKLFQLDNNVSSEDSGEFIELVEARPGVYDYTRIGVSKEKNTLKQ